MIWLFVVGHCAFALIPVGQANRCTPHAVEVKVVQRTIEDQGGLDVVIVRDIAPLADAVVDDHPRPIVRLHRPTMPGPLPEHTAMAGEDGMTIGDWESSPSLRWPLDHPAYAVYPEVPVVLVPVAHAMETRDIVFRSRLPSLDLESPFSEPYRIGTRVAINPANGESHVDLREVRPELDPIFRPMRGRTLAEVGGSFEVPWVFRREAPGFTEMAVPLVRDSSGIRGEMYPMERLIYSEGHRAPAVLHLGRMGEGSEKTTFRLDRLALQFARNLPDEGASGEVLLDPESFTHARQLQERSLSLSFSMRQIARGIRAKGQRFIDILPYKSSPYDHSMGRYVKDFLDPRYNVPVDEVVQAIELLQSESPRSIRTTDGRVRVIRRRLLLSSLLARHSNRAITEQQVLHNAREILDRAHVRMVLPDDVNPVVPQGWISSNDMLLLFDTVTLAALAAHPYLSSFREVMGLSRVFYLNAVGGAMEVLWDLAGGRNCVVSTEPLPESSWPVSIRGFDY